MQQRYSYYFTYNYVHLYNLVWRENAGTERTQRGWRKLADIRKGEKSSWSIKNARKEHWFSKPTEKMGNVYYSSLYIWGKLKKKKNPVRHLPETTDLYSLYQHYKQVPTEVALKCTILILHVPE